MVLYCKIIIFRSVLVRGREKVAIPRAPSSPLLTNPVPPREIARFAEQRWLHALGSRGTKNE